MPMTMRWNIGWCWKKLRSEPKNQVMRKSIPSDRRLSSHVVLSRFFRMWYNLCIGHFNFQPSAPLFTWQVDDIPNSDLGTGFKDLEARAHREKPEKDNKDSLPVMNKYLQAILVFVGMTLQKSISPTLLYSFFALWYLHSRYNRPLWDQRNAIKIPAEHYVQKW